MRVLQVPFLPHAIVYLLLEALVCFARVAGEALGVSVGIVPLSLSCPSHLTLEHKCVSRAAVAGEVLLPGQVVAVGKSLGLSLLTSSVAGLSWSPRGP